MRAKIEKAVQSLLDAKGESKQVLMLEAELNRLAYQAYGLTKAEIALIEAGEMGDTQGPSETSAEEDPD